MNAHDFKDIHTIVDILRERAKKQSSEVVYSYLSYQNMNDMDLKSLTYMELDKEARKIGAYLQKMNLMEERAILLYPQGLEFIKAFYGCLYAGTIAIPTYQNLSIRYISRIIEIINSSSPKVIMTTRLLKERLMKILDSKSIKTEFEWVIVDDIDIEFSNKFIPCEFSGDKIAYLQYTSGSTSTPKGVIIDHNNILHNSNLIYKNFGHSRNSRGVGWIPYYHDMGLLINILQPLYGGFPQIIMSPMEFIQNPYLWLKSISKFKITTSGAPNFAYDLCTEMISDEQCETLDLSSWKLAFSGAEPVRRQTLEKFYNKFKANGFCFEAFYPGYGMAETTLIVSGGEKSKSPNYIEINADKLKQNSAVKSLNENNKKITLVSNGCSLESVNLKIIDPYCSTCCENDNIGEIWVASPSVSRGYWNNEEASKTSFQAYTKDTKEGPFFRTGDLGFIDSGELYITGRLKEVIIIHGVNYYPKDIELTVQNSHFAIAQNAGAAFSIEIEGTEKLVVVQEIRRSCRKNFNPDDVIRAICRKVAEEHELNIYAILLLKPGSIPKTTSGKIQRSYCKKLFINNKFSSIYSYIKKSEKQFTRNKHDDITISAFDDVYKILKNKLASIIDVLPENIEEKYSLLSQGLDSITIIMFKQQIENEFKIQLPMTLFFDKTCNLEKLSKHILSLEQKPESLILSQITPDTHNLYSLFPLTDLQYAYWIGCNQQFELGSVSAHYYFEMECRNISYPRLNEAWNKIIDRHDMLRSIIDFNGQQKILPNTSQYQIRYYNLMNSLLCETDETLETVRREMSHQIMAKDKGPLFDIRFVEYKDKCSRMHFSIDLINCDIWSLNIILREWFLVYTNREIDLPKLSISFRDYVINLQKIKHTKKYEESKRYWENRLKELPPAPQLPMDKSPETIKKVYFKRQSAKIEAGSWMLLKKKAKTWGVTPSNVLLASFAKILSTWSKSNKFTINITIFNRLGLHPDINKIVGDFTSIILLAIDDSIEESFGAFTQKVQQQLLIDLENRYYSGIEVMRNIDRKRSSKSRSIMPIVFTSALSSQDKMVMNTSSFFGKCKYAISQTPQVWLDHQVYEEDGDLVLNWDAVEEIFPEKILTQMFESYILFLNNLANDDELWTRCIRSLIPLEQLKHRIEYNNTNIEYPNDEFLHSTFIKQAGINPNQIAIVTDNEKITYCQLLQASTKVAHFLRKKNITSNQLVAIYMQKGWEQIVAVLGVLQAGGAYLSIDPELPLERIEYILKNAKIKVILTQKNIKIDSEISEIYTDFVIDKDVLLKNNLPILRNINNSSNDLAYVIYTSGSTGAPKGVMITHKGALNTVLDINQKFKITKQDKILALSSLSFDLSVYDIFGILSTGGTIVLPAPNMERNPDYLINLLSMHGVTIWNSVPALMEILVENAEQRKFSLPLRVVLLSGDWIPIKLPDRIKNLSNNTIEIIGLGGATEASIWSIYYPIKYVNNLWKSIPYGKPLSNQKFYVLNGKMGDCPDLVNGELYIGGIGVAKGYLGDVEKTAHSFITHPETGEYLYRTGDIGRFMTNGNIEFLGREDFQTKIGGFRVEIGEIESKINAHPEVSRAAVKKIVGDEGQEFFCAYIIPKKKHAISTCENESEITKSPNCELILDPIQRKIFKLKHLNLVKSLKPTIPLLVEVENNENIAMNLNRSSTRNFLNKSITFKRFSAFLGCLRQMEDGGIERHSYGSAGGLYPVQIYIYIKPNKIASIKDGFYYYNPRENNLYEVNVSEVLNKNIHVKVNQSIFESSAFSIFMVAQLEAIEPLYGSKSRDFCLIEAGLITQLIESSAIKHDIGLCQIGVLKDESVIRKILQLNSRQVLIHSIIGGLADLSDLQRTRVPQVIEDIGHENLIQEISLKCRSSLPKYMIPARYMILENMPLTSVGKVNYKNLPVPQQDVYKKISVMQKPENEMEKIILDIICLKLGIKSVDLNMSFFEMGIDSLSIMKIWRLLIQETKIDFPVVKIFEHFTIKKLAGFLNTYKVNLVDDNSQLNENISERQKIMNKRMEQKRLRK